MGIYVFLIIVSELINDYVFSQLLFKLSSSPFIYILQINKWQALQSTKHDTFP